MVTEQNLPIFWFKISTMCHKLFVYEADFFWSEVSLTQVEYCVRRAYISINTLQVIMKMRNFEQLFPAAMTTK